MSNDNKQVSSLDEAATLFDNNADCTADTRTHQYDEETEDVAAMTKETFIKLWQNQQTAKPQVVFDGEMQFLKMVISDNTSTDVEAIKIINAINNYLKCVQQCQPPLILRSKEPTEKDIAWAKTKIAEYESQETKPTGLRWVNGRNLPDGNKPQYVTRYPGIPNEYKLLSRTDIKAEVDAEYEIEWLSEPEETKPVEDKRGKSKEFINKEL